MIKKMNLVRPALFAALLCGVSAASALAQAPTPPPAPGAPGPLTTPPPLLPLSSPPPPPPPGQARHAPPRPNPLFDALDTNHDGVISADEIANASASLKALLKNGSDHLTRDDLRPPLPPPASPGAPGNQDADAADKPRPKVGAIRPHGPPMREDENTAERPEGRRMHLPPPDREQAREDFDRPDRGPEGMREHRRPARMEDDEMDDQARPFPRHERMSRHEGPSRLEDEDQDGRDRPHHPEGMREEQGERPRHPDAMRDEESARPPQPPRPESAEREDGAGPRPHPFGHDGAGPQSAQHGPPPKPLFDALDTNHDGTISADEIANAPAALKGMLKNGSDHLTRDDLRPSGPPPGDR